MLFKLIIKLGLSTLLNYFQYFFKLGLLIQLNCRFKKHKILIKKDLLNVKQSIEQYN